MSNQLTQDTKNLIKKIIVKIENYYLEEDAITYSNEPCADYPPLTLKKVKELAIDKFCNEFDKIEDDYQLLSEYWNEQGEVTNYENLKQLSCAFAESL